MAQNILTISMITREALRVLENTLAFSKGVNRNYDEKFGEEGAKIGSTLNIRKPARFIGRTGQAISIENFTEDYVPLTLDTQFGVDVQFTSADLKLSMDDFSQRFVKPAIAAVANKIDRDGMLMAKNSVYNFVGAPGTTPSALLTYLQAGALMDYEGCPRDGLRSLAIDPNAQATIVDALKGLFQSSEKIKDQYESGNMGETAGFKWSMDQNVVAQTVGTLAGTPVMNGATADGASQLVTNGWTASTSTLNKGDIISVASVNAVNPQTRASTGSLRSFVVTANVVADASGNMTIPISPSIKLAGQFQNVDSLPANSAAIKIYAGASTNTYSAKLSPCNLAYHRDAFVLASADLQLPRGVDMAARISDKKLGLSVRMVRAYDINNDMFPCRLDVLYGWKAIYPELACRIQG